MSREVFREMLIRRWEAFSDPWCVKEVRPAFDGDLDAVGGLVCGLSSGKRGALVISMWQARVAVPAFRLCLANVWDHDHRELIAAADRRRLGALFRYADFPKPAGLPDVVRVWRGTSFLTEKQAARGYSWTTSRDVGCWFALRFAERNGRPLLLVADVPVEDVALFHDERNEAEAVIIRPVISPARDGCIDDWRPGHARQAVRWRR